LTDEAAAVSSRLLVSTSAGSGLWVVSGLLSDVFVSTATRSVARSVHQSAAAAAAADYKVASFITSSSAAVVRPPRPLRSAAPDDSCQVP